MFAVVSSTFSLVLLAVDGFVMPLAADDWASAAPADQRVAFLVARAVEHVNLMLFSMFVLLYFGITIGLYGVAVLTSTEFPQWLGWTAVATGAVATVASSYQLLVDVTVPSTAAFLTCWIVTACVQTALGVLLHLRERVRPSGPRSRA